MKINTGRKAGRTPRLLATTLPATGLTLLAWSGSALAQVAAPAVEPFPPSQSASVSLQNHFAGEDGELVTQDKQAPPVPDPAKPAPAPAPAQTPAPPVDPNAPVISDIVVTGAKSLSKTFIITASGHAIGEVYSDDVLSDMRTRLFATGYFGGHSVNEADAVKVQAQEISKGKFQITIAVDENDTITGINLTGTGPIKPEDVLNLLHIKPGSAYNDKQFLLDALDIQELYRKRGYIATLTDSSIDANGVLNVTVVVTRVAEIKINGNHKTKRSVILRAMTTKEGDYLNIQTLERDQANLINLDLFEPGQVNPADYPLGPGRVGIRINVVEKRTGTVTAGFGYSNRAQLIGFAEIVETNFRGMGESINLRGELGGAAGRASVEAGFTEPYLDRKRTSLSVQIYNRTVYRFSNSLNNSAALQSSTGSDNRYNEQRIGSTITVSRPFLQTYRGAVSLRGEDVRTDPLDLSIQNAQIIQNGPIVVLGGTLLHNTRDLDLDPIAGGFQSLNLQAGFANLRAPKTFTGLVIPGVAGNVNFSKAYLEARQYYSLSGPRARNKPDQDKTSVALRFLLGASVGTLPFFEQFFVGGGENLRGYRDDRFWGRNLFLGSAEFRQPLAKKLKGVLFVDVGDAWGGDYTNVSIPGFTQNGFKPHIGVGAGIRVVTPIGPLRLDYGIGDEGGRAHFSIGPTF